MLFDLPGRNWIVGLDDYRSGVTAIRTPVHCTSVSTHPENDIFRMTFWAEPLCYSWVDQEGSALVMFLDAAAALD